LHLKATFGESRGRGGREGVSWSSGTGVFFPSALRALGSTLEKGFAFKKTKATQEKYI